MPQDAEQAREAIRKFRRTLTEACEYIVRVSGRSLYAYIVQYKGQEGLWKSIDEFLKRRDRGFGEQSWRTLCRLLGELDFSISSHADWEDNWKYFRESSQRNSARQNRDFGCRKIYKRQARCFIERADSAYQTCFKHADTKEALISYVESLVGNSRRTGHFAYAATAARAISTLLLTDLTPIKMSEAALAALAAYALFQGVWSAKLVSDEFGLESFLSRVQRLQKMSDDRYVRVIFHLTSYYLAHCRSEVRQRMSREILGDLYLAYYDTSSSIICSEGQSEAGLFHNLAGCFEELGAGRDDFLPECGNLSIDLMYKKSLRQENNLSSIECRAHRVLAVQKYYIKHGQFDRAADLQNAH